MVTLTNGYGKLYTDPSVPEFDRKSFIKDNAELIVVADKDELRDILKFPNNDNLDDDTSLLLNSRRLEFSDPKAVADIIRNRFGEKFTESPFAGLSDAEIFSNIKSRHIQSMSELDSYSEYLASSLSASIATKPAIEEKAEVSEVSASE